MKTIAIANYKGGTCKTTTALNLAAELTGLGQRVLVIDADSSANATVGLGLAAEKMPHLLYALDDPPAALAAGIVESEWGVDVVPAGKRMGFVEAVLEEHLNPAKSLRDALDGLPDGVYDTVIVDCPAQFGIMTRLAMTAADLVIVPIEVKSADSLDGLVTLWRDLRKVRATDNPSVVGRILICRGDRTRLAREVTADLNRHAVFGAQLFRKGNKPLVIRESVGVAESRMRQVPVREHDPHGVGAKDFFALATSIVDSQQAAMGVAA